ncbi:MAG TPA: P1 family peptidase [Gaiellaceae bacterium]
MKARELGIEIGGLEPGPLDAITDVAGVRVGHTTLIEGEAVRTGVTAILPTPAGEPCFAEAHRLNGNGELTGLEWIRESGLLTTPIGLTNTFSVGVVRDAIVASQHAANRGRWHLPVVGETYDGFLNEIEGMHVHTEHALAAIEDASEGPVPEGCVGGGTGMICHGFKGGIGTASRLTGAGHTVGVLVQANHGRRLRLSIDGVPVGAALGPERVPLPAVREEGSGSIIVIVATDAPLLPHQCRRLAQRAALGIARTGGAGENSSGDFALAFATGNGVGAGELTTIELLPNEQLDPLFYATIEATEEAIVNALLSAETMSGRSGTVHALPHDMLVEALRR